MEAECSLAGEPVFRSKAAAHEGCARRARSFLRGFGLLGHRCRTGAMVAWPMLRAVLADLHVGQHEGDIDRFASTVRELSGRGVDEVIFLGDLFRTLVGYPRYWNDGVRAGLDLLRKLRDRGVRIVLVEGNRDFYLDLGALDRFATWPPWPTRSSSPVGGSFSNTAISSTVATAPIVSGGSIEEQYRQVSRRQPARSVARLIVTRTEARLASTNFSYRRTLPVDDLAATARRHFRAGVHVVLWGHFHNSWVLREGGCEAFVSRRDGRGPGGVDCERRHGRDRGRRVAIR